MFLETFKVIKNKNQAETEEVTRLQVRCSFATLEPTKKSFLIQGWNYQINDSLGVTGRRNTKIYYAKSCDVIMPILNASESIMSSNIVIYWTLWFFSLGTIQWWRAFGPTMHGPRW